MRCAVRQREFDKVIRPEQAGANLLDEGIGRYFRMRMREVAWDGDGSRPWREEHNPMG